jgi:hypothetical protein
MNSHQNLIDKGKFRVLGFSINENRKGDIIGSIIGGLIGGMLM